MRYADHRPDPDEDESPLLHWAVVMGGLKIFGFLEMLFFVFILFVGYIYVWKKGALEWE
jgi:NADH-quinone oxidoreductase subunit A